MRFLPLSVSDYPRHQLFRQTTRCSHSSFHMNTYRSEVAGKKSCGDWLTSQGHRAAIEGNFTRTDIGVEQDASGAFYCTQIFVLTQ